MSPLSRPTTIDCPSGPKANVLIATGRSGLTGGGGPTGLPVATSQSRIAAVAAGGCQTLAVWAERQGPDISSVALESHARAERGNIPEYHGLVDTPRREYATARVKRQAQDGVCVSDLLGLVSEGANEPRHHITRGNSSLSILAPGDAGESEDGQISSQAFDAVILRRRDRIDHRASGLEMATAWIRPAEPRQIGGRIDRASLGPSGNPRP